MPGALSTDNGRALDRQTIAEHLVTNNEHRTPEFLAISRDFEELHPQPPMFGRSALERALVEMWTRRIELGLMRAITDHFVHGNDFWKGRREQAPE